jgi:hypothetical protein
MAKNDFAGKQPKPENGESQSRAPHPEGGEPTTGFVQAPKTPQDRGGPGEGIPPSNRKIR